MRAEHNPSVQESSWCRATTAEGLEGTKWVAQLYEADGDPLAPIYKLHKAWATRMG